MKTPGQIACDAFHKHEQRGSKSSWDASAEAVIAEHERRKAEQVKPDPNAACKMAMEQGKRIQRSMPNGQWATATTPQWYPHIEYRVHPDDIKPEWKLPDPPEGEQWHRTDWTQDMLPDGYRPLLLGETDQDGDECDGCGKWQVLYRVNSVTALLSPRCRTTRPLPVKPDPFAAEKAAFAAGKMIQCRDTKKPWMDCDSTPCWFHDVEYRVKPDPVLVPLGPTVTGELIPLVESILGVLKSHA